MMYTLRHAAITGKFVGVTRTADGAQIPADARNGDFQAFLAWNAVQTPPLDPSDRPGESDAERVQRLASAAVSDVLTRSASDPFAAALVALFDVAFTLINDEREQHGRARLTSAELFPMALQALTARQGG